MNRSQICSFSLVALVLGAPALAQMVVPPPAQPVTPPEFVLAPEPPAPAAQPPRPVTATRARPVAEPLPDLPYKRLAQVDPATGKFAPLTKPAEWLAVEHNPMLTAEDIKTFEHAMSRRKEAYELLVLNNLALIDSLENGLIDHADPGAKEEFGGIVRATKPLMSPAAPPALAGDLERLGLMTPTQANFSRKIANEYSSDIVAGPELVAQGKRGDPSRSMVEIYKQRLEEPIYTFHQMQIEASQSLATLIKEVYVPQDLIDRLMTYAKRITLGSTDAERIAIMTEMEATLSPEQRRGLYAALLHLRPKIANIKSDPKPE